MNNLLADGAIKALGAKGFETQKGYCSRFCRQVCEFVYGDSRYDKLWRPDSDPSAKEAAFAFEKAGYAVSRSNLQIGDLLFKTTGEFGHVGILTDTGIAENSTYHWNRHPGDARGLRSLSQFGTFQIAIRLPSPVEVATPDAASPVLAEKPQPLLVWNGTPFPVAFKGGRPYIQLSVLCDHQGQIITATSNRLGEDPPRFYVNSRLKVTK